MSPDDPWPLAFVIVGTIASFLLALSPIPLILKVHRSKDVGFYRPDAFVVGIAFGIANGTYSVYSKQTVAFISTMITFVLYSVYLGIFTYYSKAMKRGIYKKVIIVLALATFLTGVGPIVFRIVDSTPSGSKWLAERGGVDDFIKTWLGVCATISVTLLLSGQVPAMIQVFKTRDARPISTEITLGATFASASWMTYAILIGDMYYIVSNGLGLFTGLFLIFLKLKYKAPPPPQVNKSESVVFGDELSEFPVKDQANP